MTFENILCVGSCGQGIGRAGPEGNGSNAVEMSTPKVSCSAGGSVAASAIADGICSSTGGEISLLASSSLTVGR